MVARLVLSFLAIPAVLLASRATAQPFGAPPFDAWFGSREVYVVPSREKLWPSLGILRYGDTVRVVGCSPSCEVRGAWATLEPFGAVAMTHLLPMPRPLDAERLGPTATFRYARVTGRSVASRAGDDATSPVVETFDTDDEIVLAPDDAGAPDGYVVRPDGGLVLARDLTMLTPSSFAGWVDPPRRFAFAYRETTLTMPDGTTRPVARYERFTYLGQGGGVIRVEGGTLPFAATRLGRARPRPRRIPANARWVHIDLNRQVLTAYEGDTLVFATLVSAGKHEGTTQTGRFRVVRKLRYTTMKAESRPGDSYFVEGVEHVQYFHGGVAFHMAYWHDRFGTPMSHGCVNLSPADARWLFAFSPGDVPEGWRGLNPLAAGIESLYVRVERARL